MDLEGIALSKTSQVGALRGKDTYMTSRVCGILKRHIYDFTCMWNIKKQLTSKKSKNKLLEADDRLVVGVKRGRRAEWGKGFNCRVMDGNFRW